MRRYVVQLAFFVAVMGTSLYGQQTQDVTSPQGVQRDQPIMNMGGRGGDGGHGGFSGNRQWKKPQLPDIHSNQVIKDFSSDGQGIVLENGLVLHVLDKSGADALHSLFKAGDKVAVKFSRFGLLVKPVSQKEGDEQSAIRMAVWEVPAHSDVTIKSISGRTFELSDGTKWKVGFFVPKKFVEHLKEGTPVVPIVIESNFGFRPHAIIYFNDTKGSPQRVFAGMVGKAGQGQEQAAPEHTEQFQE